MIVKYYKLEPSRNAKRYRITTKDDFETITEGKYPYMQRGDDGKLRQFAICPSCLNPVQLVGLYKAGRKYAKHTGKRINGLSEWNQYNYEHCPFATRNRAVINPEERLDEITDNVRELYQLLKLHFDRVVYIIQKELHIRFSKAFLTNALAAFVNNKDYLYPWLTETNLPYIFAYFAFQHKSIYSQKIEIGSDLYRVLKRDKRINFVKSNLENYDLLKTNKYSCIELRFIHHRQMIEEDMSLKETLLFCVDIDNETVFEQTLVFDETIFMKLVNSKGNEDKRNKEQLNIAEMKMMDI